MMLPLQLTRVEDIKAKRLKRVILIDDSTQKIINVATQLYDEEPELRPLLERFTHIAFNPEQSGRIQGTIFPGVVHIVTMRDWSEVAQAMAQIRR